MRVNQSRERDRARRSITVLWYVFGRVRGEGKVVYQTGFEKFETEVDTNWHTYRIEVTKSARVEFVKDGEMVGRTEQALDLEEYGQRAIQVLGRSHNSSPILIDNIRLIESTNRNSDDKVARPQIK